MFKNGDVICFFGDSITANGLWMAEVYQTLRKKYGAKVILCFAVPYDDVNDKKRI